MKKIYIMPKYLVEQSECFIFIAESSQNWDLKDEGAGNNPSLSKESIFSDDDEWGEE